MDFNSITYFGCSSVFYGGFFCLVVDFFCCVILGVFGLGIEGKIHYFFLAISGVGW